MIDKATLWDMQLFVAVIEGGSIAAGARAAAVTASAASKRITALEERLGVRLLQRTTRSLRTTDEGERYLVRAKDLLAGFAALESDVREQRGSLSGDVRLSAPTLLGQEVVSRVVARFSVAHPEVRVRLSLVDRLVDLTAESIDLAVRISDRLRSKELVARHAGVITSIPVASPAYLERRGRPTDAASLVGHALLELEHATPRGEWTLSRRDATEVIPVRGTLVVSSLGAIHRAALEGAGIAMLPTYLVADDLASGRLERALPATYSDRRTVFVVQPSRTYVPARVRALADALVVALPPALRRT